MFHPQTTQSFVPHYSTAGSSPEVDMSWSVNTTPDFDEIDEVIRQNPPPCLAAQPEARIRIMRESIKKRRRLDNVPRQNWAGRPFHEFGQPFNMSCSLDGSDGTSSAALTIITSASSSCGGDPLSASGIIEEEDGDGPADWSRDEEDDSNDQDDHGNAEDDVSVVPKIEPVEDEQIDLGGLKDAAITTSPDTSTTLTTKRKRGRPRKNPEIPRETVPKPKGRSKTGCLTCRRRKKKCDEAKPICLNCEKNNAVCEGYPERTIWKSGKERRAEDGTVSRTSREHTGELIAATAHIRKISIPTVQLKSIIHGVDTDGDRMFLNHYVYRLSCIFTVEGEKNNAFKAMMLPLAVQHRGLMHSILSLAGRHIDFSSNYGAQLLKDYPNVNKAELVERCAYHHDEAWKILNGDIEQQKKGEEPEEYVVSARYGQMICMVMETLSDTDVTNGGHRVHLMGYRNLIQQRPPSDQEFLAFIVEFFNYHISMDELIHLPPPSNYHRHRSDAQIAAGPLPPIELISTHSDIRMLGVCDGLFNMMSHITVLRNTIRHNMEAGEDACTYTELTAATNLDAAIRQWQPKMPKDDPRYPAALLYKQMAWVYLYRTVHVSPTTRHERLQEVVDVGLEIIHCIPPTDPTQTLLLGPIFTLGLASYEESQRVQIRQAIGVVKNYMQYRNSDHALQVLEKMWILMDANDPKAWDWQKVSKEDLKMDFLAT